MSKEKGAKFPAEKGRYHLYVSYACPWVSVLQPNDWRPGVVRRLTRFPTPKANRTLIARKLKGLEDIISFSVVHWHMGGKGKEKQLPFPPPPVSLRRLNVS